jgi:hypothetical protein
MGMWWIGFGVCRGAGHSGAAQDALTAGGSGGRNPSGPVRVIVEAQIELAEPSAEHGLVTWYEVRVVEGFEGTDRAVIARARVARIHVGAALDAGELLRDVLDADSSELAALYPVFYDEQGLRQHFTQGAGGDLLYVAAIVEPHWEERNIEHALVRRACDTLGQVSARLW